MDSSTRGVQIFQASFDNFLQEEGQQYTKGAVMDAISELGKQAFQEEDAIQQHFDFSKADLSEEAKAAIRRNFEASSLVAYSVMDELEGGTLALETLASHWEKKDDTKEAKEKNIALLRAMISSNNFYKSDIKKFMQLVEIDAISDYFEKAEQGTDLDNLVQTVYGSSADIAFSTHAPERPQKKPRPPRPTTKSPSVPPKLQQKTEDNKRATEAYQQDLSPPPSMPKDWKK